jgi:Rieske 2Fe-2S family protein
MNNSSFEAIETSIENYQAGYSLQQSFYKNPEIFKLEIDNIFLKNWIFAGHESQISEVGNFFTLNFDTESIIIVRSSKNAIKAHINVCRHRGSKVCTEEHGTKKLFTCPYHAWSYNLDGKLLSARNMSDDFERSANNLKPVHLELVGGLIFVSLAETPPSLDAMNHDLREIINHYGVEDLKLAEHKTYRIPANWKLAVENYQECYHCTPSHQEFAQIHAMAKSPEIYEALKSEFWSNNKDDFLFKTFNYYFDLAKPSSESYQYDRNPLI